MVAAATAAVVVAAGAYALNADAEAEKAKPDKPAGPVEDLTRLLEQRAPCPEIRAAVERIGAPLPADIQASIDALCPPTTPAPAPPEPGAPAAPASPASPLNPAPYTDVQKLLDRLSELLLSDPAGHCAELRELVKTIEANGGSVPAEVQGLVGWYCPEGAGK